MKKEIKVLGETVTIAFNMATQLGYEEIADKPFSLANLNSSRDLMICIFACIAANNPDTSITIDRLLLEATGKEIQTLDTALAECVQDWFAVPAVATRNDEAEAEASKPN